MNSEVSEFDPPNTSLRKSVGRGAIATAISQAIQVAAQIASVLILSRLLSPGDFGLMAMIAPVVAFIGMLQDFGLSQATIQKKKLERDEVNFLFWINLVACSAIGIILICISPLISFFYQEPRAALLTSVMALPMMMNALGAQHIALLNRKMQFGRIAIITISAAIFTLASAIILALINPTYWALFGASLVGATVSTLMAWLLSPWRPEKPKRAGEARTLVGFGAGITGFNFANFFARNLDNVMIGRVWGEQQLGYYDRAYKLLLFPLNQISNPLSRVMIPALSRILDEPGRYRFAFFRVLKISLYLILPGVSFAIAMADTLIPLVLGSQWTASAKIFMALGFAGMLQPLNNPTGWLFISQGRSTDFMVWGFVQAGFAVAAFASGIPWGAQGVAIAYAISEYVKTPILWLFLGQKGPVRFADAATSCAPSILASHSALAIIYVFYDNFAAKGVTGIAAAVLCSYGSYSLILACFKEGRETINEVFFVTRRILNKFFP